MKMDSHGKPNKRTLKWLEEQSGVISQNNSLNYEQKYKKSLEVARKILEFYKDPAYKHVYDYAKEDLPGIFPELKENESENMKKDIKTFLESHRAEFLAKTGHTSWWFDQAISLLDNQSTPEPETYKIGFIDKLQCLLNNARKQGHIVIRVEDIEKAFPELNESDGELLWLKDYLESEWRTLAMDIRDSEDTVKIENLKKSLAWIEDHKYTEEDLDRAYKCADEVQYMNGYNDAKEELEKQDEERFSWNEKTIADIFEKVGLAKIVREKGSDKLTKAVQMAMIELTKQANSESKESEDVNVV